MLTHQTVLREIEKIQKTIARAQAALKTLHTNVQLCAQTDLPDIADHLKEISKVAALLDGAVYEDK